MSGLKSVVLALALLAGSASAFAPSVLKRPVAQRRAVAMASGGGDEPASRGLPVVPT